MATRTRFTRASIDFIVRASKQKRPEWLDKNRAEYEKVLVEPFRELMEVAKTELKDEAPGYRFPRGNYARIRRNAARDRETGPFRDWVAVSISRDSGSRYEGCPNLYFQLDEEDVLSAGGLYLPSADQTKHIRKWIDQDPSLLEALLEDRAFRKRYPGLGDERVLKTKPRDYPTDHPRFEWLRLSGWYVWRPFPKKIAFSTSLADELVEDWRQVLRLNRILDQYTSRWPKAQGLETFEKVSPRPMDF